MFASRGKLHLGIVSIGPWEWPEGRTFHGPYAKHRKELGAADRGKHRQGAGFEVFELGCLTAPVSGIDIFSPRPFRWRVVFVALPPRHSLPRRLRFALKVWAPAFLLGAKD